MLTRTLCLMAFTPLLLTAQKVAVHVHDQDGNAVENASVKITYEGITNLGKTHEVKGITDVDGQFRSSGNAKVGLWFWVKKDGYYDHGYYPAERDIIGMNYLNDEIEKSIELRQIINPIALYGRFEGGGKIPLLGESCGYDLAEGDWVVPHGDGKTADILIMFDREFIDFDTSNWQRTLEERREFSKKAHAVRGEEWTEEKFQIRSGNWDMLLEIDFPGEKEGIIKVEDAFNEQSVLRMPHEAYEEGYTPDYGYQIKSDQYLQRRKDIGFFLRTRVVLDDDGEIESANYAKVHGDFRITVDGKVSFTYYFNPTPNDRNLEFERNLFPEGAPGTFNFVLP